MNSLVFDIETDDQNATNIMSMIICNVDTENVCSYWGDDLDKGLKELQDANPTLFGILLFLDLTILYFIIQWLVN